MKLPIFAGFDLQIRISEQSINIHSLVNRLTVFTPEKRAEIKRGRETFYFVHV